MLVKKDTPTSKNNTANKLIKPKEPKSTFINITFKINKAIIATNVCPANIFADNLIAKLKHLIIYENNSIIIIKGNNAIGHWGINIFKNSIPFNQKPKTNIAKPRVKDIHNIIIKWLVNDTPKGIKLNKLANKTNINIVNTKGT